MAAAGSSTGMMIWIPHVIEAWTPAVVLGVEGNDLVVKLTRLNNATARIPGPVTQYDPVTPEALDHDHCENLVDMETYNEGIILHHVRKRFLKGQSQIYTYVGSILVAVNPYKPLDIYAVPVMEKVIAQVQRLETPSPHVYSIAAAALFGMREEGKDQCVLISGESGAGKTEATKKIIQFISTMAKSSMSRTGIDVETQILDSNPILEGFGNAKTIRNNNSSRFGKYMTIHFDKKHNIRGCHVTAYLLEKTRVVKVSSQERNYHVFYMLLEGASKELRQEFALKPASQFRILSMGDCVAIDKRAEKFEYSQLTTAFTRLGVSDAALHDIFRCLAAVLHCGNLAFQPSKRSVGNDEGSQINPSQANDCRKIAVLLGLPSAESLEQALCFRESVVSGSSGGALGAGSGREAETFRIPLDPQKAADQRDALCKYIYGKVFDLVVSYVNNSLARTGSNNSSSQARKIGVLDIFGFEVFRENSFEQLCINYCNERLQTFFNEVIFEGEMRLYAADGVPCDDITYQDNLGCLRLIELKGAGSVFSMMDEEIVLPQGSDDKLVAKMHTAFDESNATKSPYYIRNRKQPKEFGIRHFAGDVIYNVSGFLEKNKDLLAAGLVKLIDQSSLAFVHSAYDCNAQNEQEGNNIPTVTAVHKTSKLTLSAKFKLDLDSLMYALRQTTPHFVRCVKPNEFQMPDRFEPPLVLNQLKYSGLFEAIRIRKAGYAVRVPHAVFMARYSHIPQTPLQPLSMRETDPQQYCQRLMALITPMVDAKAIERAAMQSAEKEKANKNKRFSVLSREVAQWCVGKTRVYLRTQFLKNQLEQLRVSNAGNRVHQIQRLVRGYISRKRFYALVTSVMETRQAARAIAKAEIERMALEDRLSTAEESAFRGDVELQRSIAEAKKARFKAESERKRLKLIRSAALIQRMMRGWLGRIKGRRSMCETALERALSSRDIVTLRKAIDMPRKLLSSRINTANNAPRHIKAYQQIARTQISNILHESYISNKLNEAIDSLNIELLQAAITTAEDGIYGMPYIPELNKARRTLEDEIRSRTVLKAIEFEVAKCSSIPSLLQHADAIQPLCRDALSLGLGGEYIVQNAVGRLGRVKTLLVLRNDMRRAVELCSQSRMEKAMLERNRQARVFGPDLCADEVLATFGMVRMIIHERNCGQQSSQSQPSAPTATAVVSSRPRGDSADDTMTFQLKDKRDRKSSINQSDSSSSLECKSNSDTAGEESKVKVSTVETETDIAIENDVRLPPFVRVVLDQMRDAPSLEAFNEAVEKLLKLVPNEPRRRAFIRVYKWVVAFANWRYKDKTAEEVAAHAQQMKLVELHEERVRQQRDILHSTAAIESTGSSAVKRPQASYLTPTSYARHYSKPSAFKDAANTTVQASPDGNNDGNNNHDSPRVLSVRSPLTGGKLAIGPAPYVKTPPVNVYSRRTGLRAQVSPGFSFGEPQIQQPTLSFSPTATNGSQQKRSSPSPPQRRLDIGVRTVDSKTNAAPVTDLSRSAGYNTNVYNAAAATTSTLSASPKKQLTFAETTTVLTPQKAPVSIPFSVRQSKTVVAAYQAHNLKAPMSASVGTPRKEKKDGTATAKTTADLLIQKSLNETEEFLAKHQADSRWRI